MMKHMVGQSIYQIIVLFIIIFAGEHFLPEEDRTEDGVYFRNGDGFMRSGRRYDYTGSDEEGGLYTKDMHEVRAIADS